MKTKEGEGSLKLGDELKTKFLATLSGIEDGPFG
jgi:hypothetical protein